MAKRHTNEARGRDELLDRRSMLKLTGATVAGIAASGLGGSASAARTLDVSDGEVIDPYLESISDGDVVNIPPGTYEFDGATIDADNWTVDGQGCTFDPQGNTNLYLQGDDWSFGGVRFDVPGNEQIQVWPSGNGWRLHSCAWDGPNTNVNYLIYPKVDSGHTGEIDRCWFGGGCGEDRSESAIKGNGGWNGAIWIRRTYFYQNGVYGIQTIDPPEMRGTANYDSCYFENCYLACARTGNDYGKTCEVKNCVILYDSKAETPAIQGRGIKAFRGVWAFWGDVTVTDTDITNPYGPALVTSSNHGNPSITVSGGNVDGGVVGDITLGSDVGSTPSTSPPDGCVTSVQEAIDGGATSGSDTTDGSRSTFTPETDHELVIEGTGTTTDYVFTVDETLEPKDTTIEQWDDVEGTTADGWVTSEGAADTFGYSGSITDFTFRQGEANVYVDGEQIDPTDQSSDNSKELVIEGTGTVTDYEFTVDGTLNPVDDTIESWDDTGETTADGWVASEGVTDEFEFTGSVTDFTFHRGEANVYVDGKQVDFTDDDSKELVIEGTGTTTNYQFTIDGSLTPIEDTIELWDDVEGTTADGWVTSEGVTDEFEFTGSIAKFGFAEGEANVYIDGEQVSVDEL